MATLLLGAAGAALGGILGPTAAVLGQAVGALAGNMLDNALLTPRRSVTGQRLSTVAPFSAEEGAPIPRIYGSARMPGTLIWATRLEEVSATTRHGGKAIGGGTKVTKFSYFGSFAFALCEGEIACLRRIWADGQELDLSDVSFRVHNGSQSQPPDPLLLAKQGLDNTPAYRGVAYVVFERLALERFGNRIPQFQFEVIRPVGKLEKSIKAITLIPGATEFGYEPSAVTWEKTPGETIHINRNVLHSETDWKAAIDELQAICPNLENVALVSAWFGDDLRASHCKIRPCVTSSSKTGVSRDWSCSGVARTNARQVTQNNNTAAYGGTPDDASLVHAIRDLKARGLKVTLYPFVMMDIAVGNALPSPYGGTSQQAYPWRGRITCHPAEGQPGSVNASAGAASQITTFLGSALPVHFTANGDAVSFSGSATDWGYRRMILHHARLAALAGGIDAFLIGSELAGLTRVRGSNNSFPFVSGLMQLATDVRQMLGSATKLTYGADWVEYFGYSPAANPGDIFYNLDPLWAHGAIDAIGIDWYQPLTDWRDSQLLTPAEGGPLSAHDTKAMKAGLRGGENFDWYYQNAAARQNGVRTNISDGAYGKPWVWRSKDIQSWWLNAHYNRINGVEQSDSTAWVPKSKPIWFTEIGCPAIDKGANQPNVFSDPKSAESAVPYFSTSARDDLQQRLYLETHLTAFDPTGAHFDAALNPVSTVYNGPMLDINRLYAWAYDTRPYPAFPQESALWNDGENWRMGHWLNGRLGALSLGDLVQSIIFDHSIEEIETQHLVGWMQGYAVQNPQSVRESLEPALDFFGASWRSAQNKAQGFSFDARPENVRAISDWVGAGQSAEITRTRSSSMILPTEAVFSFADPLDNYQNATVAAQWRSNGQQNQVQMSLPIVMDADTAGSFTHRWLGRVREESETLRLSLAMQDVDLEVGDFISLSGNDPASYRIEKINYADIQIVEARKSKRFPLVALGKEKLSKSPQQHSAAASGRAHVLALDLPDPVLRNGVETPVVRLAAYAKPWTRQMVMLEQDQGDISVGEIAQAATLGEIVSGGSLGSRGRRLDTRLTVRLYSGALQSVSLAALLAGANTAILRANNGAWEVFQFQNASETAANTWELSKLLRGQRGTRDALDAGFAAGAPFVLLNEAIVDVLLSGSFTDSRNLRIGPANRALSDHSWQRVPIEGLARSATPLGPEHLRMNVRADGHWFRWIRCSRINADDWDLAEIPIGEAIESYSIRILNNQGTTVRSTVCNTPDYDYLSNQRLSDLGSLTASYTFVVKQNGLIAGLGLETALQIQ